jgi:hypothetical protein
VCSQSIPSFRSLKRWLQTVHTPVSGGGLPYCVFMAFNSMRMRSREAARIRAAVPSGLPLRAE